MLRTSFFCITVSTLLLVACADGPFSVEGDRGRSTAGTTAILDGAHGGNPRFHFLPPLVEQPVREGVLRDDLSPVVRVCSLDGATCYSEFARDVGSSAQLIRVDLDEGHFVVNWDTGALPQDVETARILVTVEGYEVGHVDVQLAEKGSEKPGDGTGTPVVIRGSTVPIKFAIDGPPVAILDPTEVVLVSSEAEIEAGLFRLEVRSGSIPSIQPGTILIGSQGDGYLRRVVSASTEGTTIVASTVPAHLDEILLFESFQATIPFLDDGTGEGASEAVAWGPTSVLRAAAGVTVDPSGIHLEDVDVCEALEIELCPEGLDVVIRRGRLTFQPTVDVGAEFGFFEVEEAHVIAEGELAFDTELSLGASQEISGEGEKTLVEVSRRFQVFVPTPLGPVPVVGRAILGLIAGYEADASAEVELAPIGFESLQAATLGARYADGAWSAVEEYQASLSFLQPEWSFDARARARFYVRPELKILLYGVAGPFLGLEPALEGRGVLSQEECLLSLDTDTVLDLGITLEMLGEELASFERQVTLLQDRLYGLDCGVTRVEVAAPQDHIDVGERLVVTATGFNAAGETVSIAPLSWSASNARVRLENETGSSVEVVGVESGSVEVVATAWNGAGGGLPLDVGASGTCSSSTGSVRIDLLNVAPPIGSIPEPPPTWILHFNAVFSGDLPPTSTSLEWTTTSTHVNELSDLPRTTFASFGELHELLGSVPVPSPQFQVHVTWVGHPEVTSCVVVPAIEVEPQPEPEPDPEPEPEPDPDPDGDGVDAESDFCPATAPGASTDELGCSMVVDFDLCGAGGCVFDLVPGVVVPISWGATNSAGTAIEPLARPTGMSQEEFEQRIGEVYGTERVELSVDGGTGESAVVSDDDVGVGIRPVVLGVSDGPSTIRVVLRNLDYEEEFLVEADVADVLIGLYAGELALSDGPSLSTTLTARAVVSGGGGLTLSFGDAIALEGFGSVQSCVTDSPTGGADGTFSAIVEFCFGGTGAISTVEIRSDGTLLSGAWTEQFIDAPLLDPAYPDLHGRALTFEVSRKCAKLSEVTPEAIENCF